MDKKAVIRNGRIVYGAGANVALPHETAARARREDMRTRYRKELLQPNQTDYYRAYPDQSQNLNDETRRLLS